jgi:hypothetical protein
VWSFYRSCSGTCSTPRGLIDVLPARVKASLLALKDVGVVIFAVVVLLSAVQLTLVDGAMTTAAISRYRAR